MRRFTPAAGLMRLAVGLAWTALGGAILSAVGAGLYNAVRRGHPHG